MKLQQEAGDKGSEQRGIDGWLRRKKVGESVNMSMSLNGSSTLAVQQPEWTVALISKAIHHAT